MDWRIWYIYRHMDWATIVVAIQGNHKVECNLFLCKHTLFSIQCQAYLKQPNGKLREIQHTFWSPSQQHKIVHTVQVYSYRRMIWITIVTRNKSSEFSTYIIKYLHSGCSRQDWAKTWHAGNGAPGSRWAQTGWSFSWAFMQGSSLLSVFLYGNNFK